MQGLPGTHESGGGREKAESQISYYCHHLQPVALPFLRRTHKEQFPCSSETWPRLWPRFSFRGLPASVSPFIPFHTRAQSCPRSQGLHSLLYFCYMETQVWKFDSSVVGWKWKRTPEVKQYKPVCSSFQILWCSLFSSKVFTFVFRITQGTTLVPLSLSVALWQTYACLDLPCVYPQNAFSSSVNCLNGSR